MTCSCSFINIGIEKTEHKNLNPLCKEHGVESQWHNSTEQTEYRQQQNDLLKSLYRQAREARKATEDSDEPT